MQRIVKNVVLGLVLCGGVAATALIVPKSVADDAPPPPANEYDTSGVNADLLITAASSGPMMAAPADWIPGIGNIPAILIRPCFPPGATPIVVPTAPAAPYTPWSPWSISPSCIPTVVPAYPCGRIPGKIKWNPTRPGWDFIAPGCPPVPLAGTVVTVTPIEPGDDTPVNVTPVGAAGEGGTTVVGN